MKAPRSNALWLIATPIAAILVLFSVGLFLLGVAIFCGVGWFVTVTQRDEAAVSEADAVFKAAGAEHRARQYAADYDAVVKRLAEVLDEHANCPAPVDRFTERMVGAARAASAKWSGGKA